jgi:hypothetical protein
MELDALPMPMSRPPRTPLLTGNTSGLKLPTFHFRDTSITSSGVTHRTRSFQVAYRSMSSNAASLQKMTIECLETIESRMAVMEAENLPQSLHEYVESIDLRLKRLEKPAAREATTEECLISDITYTVSMLAVPTSKE